MGELGCLAFLVADKVSCRIIALMLGRLEMSIEEANVEYFKLFEDNLCKTSIFKSRHGRTHVFERRLKNLLESLPLSLHADSKMNEGGVFRRYVLCFFSKQFN